MLTCNYCDKAFEKVTKRGPAPKFCSDACKQGSYRDRKAGVAPKAPTPAPPSPDPGKGLTLRDVVNVAELNLSVKQCDVILHAFTKARARAVKRERD
jgi:hypothetical protein